MTTKNLISKAKKLKMMDKFIELTSVRHDQKIIININKILIVMPERIGSSIILQGREDVPLPVTEEYERLKEILVTKG